VEDEKEEDSDDAERPAELRVISGAEDDDDVVDDASPKTESRSESRVVFSSTGDGFFVLFFPPFPPGDKNFLRNDDASRLPRFLLPRRANASSAPPPKQVISLIFLSIGREARETCACTGDQNDSRIDRSAVDSDGSTDTGWMDGLVAGSRLSVQPSDGSSATDQPCQRQRNEQQRSGE
jgi:hypothetical protein